MPVSTTLRYLVCPFMLVILTAGPLWCQWERLPGPYGGSIQQFSRDGDALYALTMGGIYKSGADGMKWTLLEGTESLGRPKFSLNWFYKRLQVEAGQMVFLPRGDKLLRSKNEGKSWETIFDVSLNAGAPSESLIHCFVAGDTIFTSSNRALYRSVDAGVSWETVPDPDYFGTLHVIAKIKNTFIGRRNSSIQVSPDGGWQWKTVFTIAAPFAAVTVLDTTIYGMYSGYARLIRSRDLGASWEKFDTDTITYHQYNTGVPGWLAGSGNDLYFVTENGCQHAHPRVFYSPDQGQTWSRAKQENIVTQQLRDVDCTEEGLLLGTMDGVYRSVDRGASFSFSNPGMNAAWIDDLFQRTVGKWWAVARQGIFRSADQGQTWEEVFPNDFENDCGDANQLPRTAKRMFYPGHSTCLLTASEDNGNTWSPLPPWPHTDWPQFFCPQIVTTNDAAWFKGYNGPVYRWHDNNPVPKTFFMPFLNQVQDISAGDGLLYMYGEQKAFISSDQGVNWRKLPPLQYWDGNPEFGSHLSIDRYAIFRTGGLPIDTIFMLDYVENTWRPYFPVDAVTGDTFHRYDIRTIQYAGGLRWMVTYGRGLYYASLQAPELWYPYQPQLPAVSPRSLHLAGNEIWVGTAEAGIFRSPLHLRMPESPAPHFSLYPNPGAGEALHLTSDQFFTEDLHLRVFDTAGRLVREQVLPPGQNWTLNLPALPAGMYMLQIEASKYLTTLKWIRQR